MRLLLGRTGAVLDEGCFSRTLLALQQVPLQEHAGDDVTGPLTGIRTAAEGSARHATIGIVIRVEAAILMGNPLTIPFRIHNSLPSRLLCHAGQPTCFGGNFCLPSPGCR